MRSLVFGSLFGLIATTAAAQTSAVPTPPACAALMKLQLPGVALAVTKTEWFAAGPAPAGRGGAPNPLLLPAYCRVDGMIDRRVGAAGIDYGIGFALALPDNWNGRFLFQGGGGLNGSVSLPLGASAAGATPVSPAASPSSAPTPGIRGRAASTPLQGRSAGQPRLRLCGHRPCGGGGEADHRRALRQAGRALVFRRMLHRRARSDADGAALPAYFDGIVVGRAGDAHGLLGHRRPLGRGRR